MEKTVMQTHSGKLIDLLLFKPEDVRLIDISHALSQIVRFTGHIKTPYSVAQHSVMVSRICPEEDALWGLMHDASEAYLGDVARPLKVLLPQYVTMERMVQRIIGKAFHLPWPMPESVKVADNRALMAEKKALMAVDHDWGIEAEPVPYPITPLHWTEAKTLFEERFKELMK